MHKVAITPPASLLGPEFFSGQRFLREALNGTRLSAEASSIFSYSALIPVCRFHVAGRTLTHRQEHMK